MFSKKFFFSLTVIFLKILWYKSGQKAFTKQKYLTISLIGVVGL